MALNREYAAFIEDLLAGFGPVTVRAMFGGGGVYRDGIMFGLIADDTLYLKAEGELAGRFAAEGAAPFTYEGKAKPVTMPYWQVPERLYEEPEELAEWAARSFAVAERDKRKTRPARVTRAKRRS